MDKMGFGYKKLCELKPDIILGSVSAFGQYGPYRERPGFDPLGQAMSGLMSLTGMPVGQPARHRLLDRRPVHLAARDDRHARRIASPRPHRRGPGGRCLLMDSGLTMVEISTSYYLATGQEGGEGQGRPCRDLGLGTRDGLAAVADRHRRSQRRRQH
jgi:hypothetical protein